MKKEEDYVTYEVAKLLKEKGYDEPCDAYYHNDLSDAYKGTNDDFRFEVCDGGFVNSRNCYRDAAPTLWDAQKWLREKGISVEVHCGWDEKWYYNLWIIGSSKAQIDSVKGHFIFYETALNEGIKEALKLI